MNETLIDNGERYLGNPDGVCKIKRLLICSLDIKFIFFIHFLVNSVFVGKYFDSPQTIMTFLFMHMCFPDLILRGLYIIMFQVCFTQGDKAFVGKYFNSP